MTMYEWMDECMHEWMNEWMNECINKWMNAWMNEWMHKWMNECINKRMNGSKILHTVPAVCPGVSTTSNSCELGLSIIWYNFIKPFDYF